jgi:hypothetical protein
MMITSNEDWVVPASLRDERRYAAFNVDPELKKDNDLWLQIYKGFTGIPHKAPIAAMMYDLLRRDISNFDPIRSTPRTEALAEQALESMNFTQKWGISAFVMAHHLTSMVLSDMKNGKKARLRFRCKRLMITSVIMCRTDAVSRLTNR